MVNLSIQYLLNVWQLKFIPRVYLAVAGLGLVLNVLFLYVPLKAAPHLYTHFNTTSFCHLPEISEEALIKEMDNKGLTPEVGPFYKQYRCIFGFIAQMSYV